MTGIFLVSKHGLSYNAFGMAFFQRKDPFRLVFLLLLGLGVLALCYVIAVGQQGRQSRLQGMAGSPAKADTPLEGIPARLLEGFLLLRPDEMALVPLADGFQWPVGAPNMAMMYDAQPFGSPNPKRGGFHTGRDLNGIGGNDTDKGEPVYAAARGLVVYSGTPSGDWGNVVIVAHRLPGQKAIIQTLYAHLDKRDVSPGQLVSRGQRLGSIGTANGHYLAHLHFEAIESLCLEAGMPGYHPQGTMNRLDPAKLIARNPAPPVPDCYDAVRRILMREAFSPASLPPTP